MIEQLKEKLNELMIEKLNLLKEYISVDEAKKSTRNIQRMGRAKIIRIRFRGGKLQRRKKLSAVKGYTIRGGKMIRMLPKERLKRKIAARRAKVKRRAKMARILIKRKRTMRRRKMLGV